MKPINRREFCVKSLQVGAGIFGIAHAAPWLVTANTTVSIASNEIAVVKNGTPGQMVRKAVEALGGMSRFVQKGQKVVVKPNIGWDRKPEQAANTNPEIVAEVVKMCFAAGAAQVTVFDRACNVERRTYRNSGIKKAASEAGATVRYMMPQRFRQIEIPHGEIIKSWEIYQDVLDADVLVNLPVAKHHSMCQASMSMKNLMGVLGGDRGQIHTRFAEKICDINSVIKPQLNILDGYRILRRNGPQGGNLADVEVKKTVIAGINAVSVDAFGATLFGLKAEAIEYLSVARQRGLGEIDLKNLAIKQIEI